MTAWIALVMLLQAAPDRQLTPGVVRPLTTAQVCAIRWGRDRRHITEAMKQQVADAYGLPRTAIVARGRGPCCEFDHLVPRSEGGADVVANIWPQPWAEAVVKDQIERQVHRDVCHGRLSLAEAQDWMRHWYQR